MGNDYILLIIKKKNIWERILGSQEKIDRIQLSLRVTFSFADMDGRAYMLPGVAMGVHTHGHVSVTSMPVSGKRDVR